MPMNVVEVTEFGGPEVLRPAVRPDPVPGPGQALVQVRAANVNPADLAARAGHGPYGIPDPPFVPGWDFAGEIRQVAADVAGLRPGDRVAGMIHWYDQHGALGAYAGQVAVDTGWLVPLPDAVNYPVAATIPLNALSAAQGLDLLAAGPGAEILVTGASGAVGSFAVQLAAQAGLWVIAQASRADEEWVRSLGAAEVLPRDADLGRAGPVPFVFDAVPLGGPALAAAADGGAVVSTRPVPEADPARRIRQQSFLIRLDRGRLSRLVAAVAGGALRSRVDRVLPLAEAAQAHRLSEAGGLRGKIVLTP
jgi:NADPH:quinone reductase-like Zn-dependent oxidoreductase